MITVNAIGDACPIPVVKTLNAIKELKGPDIIETLVDNETAVQNLTRMADKKGCAVKSEKLGEKEFKVTIEVGDAALAAPVDTENVTCELPRTGKKNTVVVISSKAMGHGGDELGTALMKGFIYALSQQEQLPTTILFYNGGANIPVEGSVSLEDLKSMEAQGVEILTCGTCLNFYGLTEKLAVGEVTNMYTIVEKMTGADLIVKP
ncbi:MAG: sulfurtransferase-like selenium metabolism protein YedF [Oscillospiraceae bacterium]|nr:sulfurtransferase-like selenium metabolism protein YedF [Oscillospiraceae bacterium]